jgi:hypothetical protein
MGETNIGALTSGMLKITVVAGDATPETATPGTDFYDPQATGAPSATELGYVKGLSSAVQTQLNDLDNAIDAFTGMDVSLADGEYVGRTRTLVAKVSIGLGELVEYVLDTTLKFQLSDVSTDKAAVGICVLAAANPGDNCTVLLSGGRYRTSHANLPTLTIGAPVYRNIVTDGRVQVAAPAAAGNKLQMIGFGDVDGDTIYFEPSPNVFTVVA